MGFDLSRLRRGEQVAGVGGLLLFIALFFFKWYGTSASFGAFSFEASANGWHTHTVLRWLMLLTILAALALVVTTATQATVALPVTTAVITTSIAALTTLLLAYRVLINEPGPNEFIDVKFGAYLGVVSAAVVVYGGYLSMRDESTGTPAAEVPVRRVGAPAAPPPPPPPPPAAPQPPAGGAAPEPEPPAAPPPAAAPQPEPPAAPPPPPAAAPQPEPPATPPPSPPPGGGGTPPSSPPAGGGSPPPGTVPPAA